MTPEKDQSTELDSSENNFVEDNDSPKHVNDQISAEQNSLEDDQTDIENSYFVNEVDSEIDHSNDWILPLQTSAITISYSIQGPSVRSLKRKFMTVSNKGLNCMKLRLSLQVTIVVA